MRRHFRLHYRGAISASHAITHGFIGKVGCKEHVLYSSGKFILRLHSIYILVDSQGIMLSHNLIQQCSTKEQAHLNPTPDTISYIESLSLQAQL